jgi:mRNA interferase RelE/StbE
LALRTVLSNSAAKYLAALDRPTQARIREKLNAIAEEPFNARLSKPLSGVEQRTARVGNYRIIFSIEPEILFVADIGPRGRIYRRLER